jgi:hypothetical protein
LSDAWWASLGALAAHTITQVATPHTIPISQERLTATIEKVFLAERVQREHWADLDSRTGWVSQLFFCCETIAAGDGYAGPLAEPARCAGARWDSPVDHLAGSAGHAVEQLVYLGG